MEPITISLVAAVTIVASTHRPKWEDHLRTEQSPSTLVVAPREVRTMPLIDRRANAVSSGPSAIAPKDRLHYELMGFVPNGTEDPSIEPVSKIEEILVANEFLRKLPGSIPLPTLMRNEAGDIGMYWDNDLVYIDVDVDSGSSVSLYARNQRTDEQSLIEDVLIDEIDTAWFNRYIGNVLEPAASAA